jgi:transposase InsO family protein
VFFLDDATRFALGVGTVETTELFLRGLHRVLRRFGFMDLLFLDRDPGFKSDDTAAACRRLEIRLVLGTAGYPEGHGKIERFNQSAQAQLLRGLPGAADVDADCGALELPPVPTSSTDEAPAALIGHRRVALAAPTRRATTPGRRRLRPSPPRGSLTCRPPYVAPRS